MNMLCTCVPRARVPARACVHTLAHTDALGIHFHCCSSLEAAFVFPHVDLLVTLEGLERENEVYSCTPSPFGHLALL